MFNLFNKKTSLQKKHGDELTLKIKGMHCVSCAMNIDGELEEMDGVISATTTYASAITKIQFDPEKISKEKIEDVIQKLGYSSSAS